MGSFFSSNRIDNLDDELKKIKGELASLKDLDKNHDGIITANEVKDWQMEQSMKLKQMEEYIKKSFDDQYTNIIKDKDLQINNNIKQLDELNSQITSLKSINSSLELKLNNQHTIQPLTNINSGNAPKKQLSEISVQKINEFVDKMLTDENINIKYLPDFVERQIYINIFTILISLLNNTLDTAVIQLLGHEIKFNINPIDGKLMDIESKEITTDEIFSKTPTEISHIDHPLSHSNDEILEDIN